MKHHPETNNQYYKLWLKYEPLSYLIFFISSFGNWVNVKKIESGFFILYFCLHMLHATNLMKVCDWSFKQKYLLIKDDNVVVTFANQKLKFNVRKTERLFYQSALFFKYIDWSNFNDVIPKNFYCQCTRILPANFGQKINMLSKLSAYAETSY